MDVGRELREAREARRLSVKTLAATTRIHARVLDAIENNDRSALPARPYARGFVAAYARELGLDPNRVASQYFAQFESADDVRPDRTVIPAQTVKITVDESGDQPRWVAVVAIVGIAIAAVVWLQRVDDSRPAEPGAVGTSGTIARPAPAPSVEQRAGAPPALAATASPVTPSSGEFVITLDVAKPVWVSATADGTRVIYRILQAGTETIKARTEVVLRVGDAGALRLAINARDPVVLGRQGEVRTVRITAPDLVIEDGKPR
jgi:cytoskeleton protein RodZ